MVCKPKNKGGLGVLNLRIQNDALLLKFLHKFYNKLDIPWVQLTWDSYYAQKIPHASDLVGSFWWKDLMQLSDIYRGVTRATVGSSDSILFWKDEWKDGLFQDTFPRAFSFAKNEDVSVQNFLRVSSLDEAFHLPLSIEAHAEVRDIQRLVAHIVSDNEHTTRDIWSYTWGPLNILPEGFINSASEMSKPIKHIIGCGNPKLPSR